MSAVRRPVIVGLTGGVGTSTLATALHAHDGGRLGSRAAGGADVIVVCASAEESLRLAATLAHVPPGPRPVLAVVAGRAVAGLQEIRPRFSAVVLLPHVAHWQGRTDPGPEAAAALAQPVELLAPPLRPYAAGLRTLVAAMLGCGLLDRQAPPLVVRPMGDPLRRGVAPAPPRSVPVRPVRLRSLPMRPLPVQPTIPEPEPDDDALEAEPFPTRVPAGRAG